MPAFRLLHPIRMIGILACWGFASCCNAGVNYEEAPINYGKTTPSNAVSRLQARIDDGTVTLTFDDTQGNLRSVLEHLKVPVSSQVLTFAKTSLQAHHISPATPRAIYFNDDVHVGFVQEGLIEIAVSDPLLGMAFYTLEQSATQKARFAHNANNCLTCHGATRTRNVPGLQIRSVYPDPKGQPVVAAGSLRTDHTSPFEKRWGGWYVTGRHGTRQHLGNFSLPDTRKPKSIDNSAGQNVTDLTSRFDTSKYLSGHSDLIALLVLEHQTDAYNFLTLANFETRYALFVDAQQLKQSDAVAAEINQQTQRQIEKSGEALVRYFLFCGEASLNGPLVGTTDFAKEFAAQGRRDRHGRSLRDFDLTKRIFKYPCSYLIDSQAFDALPAPMKQFVYKRLNEILSAEKPPAEYEHLSREDRQAILSILLETKPEFSFSTTEARAPDHGR
ncbi:MAG: hypothetical protein U0941_05955 [Planctomycetaceae bacterium]